MQIHNIPSQPTPFIGRKTEINEIVTLVRDENCRLLTLLGAGGMGKTRLAIEAVKQLTTEDFEHGVFYVPLAPLNSADNLVTTVISVLCIMIGSEDTPQEELVKFLSGRNLLLVMDNFEHVLDGADLVANVLTHTDNVTILTTSREPLNLLEEQLWHVRGMRLPADAMIDNLDRFSGLKLFLDRARRVRHDFDVSNNLADSLEICRLVGGMPLGIELAASWLKTLSCTDIIKHIHSGVDFLSTRARNIPERHRSIRVVFDHSWNLLTEQEQAVFPRLSVFRGGFTLEAAKEVADADLMSLSGLVEKSIVRRDDTGRYDLHELLRQYAEEKLIPAGEVEAIESAYTSYFSDFMRERALDIKGRRQIDGLSEIEADFDNVVEVWYHAVNTENYDALDMIVEGIALYCDMRAKYQLGEDMLNATIHELRSSEQGSIHPTWNKLRIYWFYTWTLQERPIVPDTVKELIEDVLDFEVAAKNIPLIGICIWLKGELIRSIYDTNLYQDGIDKCVEAQSYLQEPAWVYYQGRTLRTLSQLHLKLADRQPESHHKTVTREYLIRHQALSKAEGDYNSLAHSTHLLGIYYLDLESNYEMSFSSQKVAHDIFASMNDVKSLGMVKTNLSRLMLFAGQFEKDTRIDVEALTLSQSVNYDNLTLIALWVRVCHKLISHEYTHAYQICQDVIVKYGNYGWAWRYAKIGLVGCSIGFNHTDQALEHFKSTYADIGDNVSPSGSRTLCCAVSAILLQHQGHDVPAVEALGSLLSLPEHRVEWLRTWKPVSDLQVMLKKQLDVETFKTAWQRGSQRSIQDTIVWFSRYFNGDDNTHPSKKRAQPLAEHLTERELEVLVLIAEGLTNPQIAGKLYLSTGTVKVHTRNIYGKLGVGNRTEAATKARDLNLI